MDKKYTFQTALRDVAQLHELAKRAPHSLAYEYTQEAVHLEEFILSQQAALTLAEKRLRVRDLIMTPCTCSMWVSASGGGGFTRCARCEEMDRLKEEIRRATP